MRTLMEKNKFLNKFNIKKEDFEQTSLEWIKLEEIYKDYSDRLPTLERVATSLAEILRPHRDVHTVRARVKDPEHLIEKIIRKTIEKKTKGSAENIKLEESNFTLENYLTNITDLIGLRILHLYKDQALEIDKMIRRNWEPCETPLIYYRHGDNTDGELKKSFELKPHRFGYRSWHYLIKTKITKDEYIAEIQVRTIFEEGWSEIDHQLRYPYHLDNQLLKNHLLLLNRLAGSADEMVNNIKETMDILDEYKVKEQKQEDMIKSLQEKIDTLSKEKKIQENDYTTLKEELNELQKSQRDTRLSLNNWDSGGIYLSSLKSSDISSTNNLFNVSSQEVSYSPSYISVRVEDEKDE